MNLRLRFFNIAMILSLAVCLASCSHSSTIYGNRQYKWIGNSIVQNDIQAYSPDSHTIISTYPEAEYESGKWELKKDISKFASYSAPTILEEAVYNMTLEECVIAVEPDSTLRTGKEWGGVWTRDISYSIILGMAQAQPACAMKSLMRKVNSRGRIIQDTGTGGSWPCSTDKNVWVLAAWEIYKTTGDQQWLDTIYPVIRVSLEDDLKMVKDEETGMFRGESSYLDWREQEYPGWMLPIDIYNSENLGTECVHFEAYRILAEMDRIKGEPEEAARHDKVADGIAEGINRYLWQEDKGFYAQYLYGRKYLSVSPRFETLGEALAILSGIADANKSERIVRNAPCEQFGIPCFYPHVPDMFPYHNDAMWPFVQSFWTMAAARVGNPDATLFGISGIYRAAAFFLTNKENMVIYNGKWQGTDINSSRQLWSVAGSLSVVYKTIFGMNFELDGLHFAPMVPKEMKGKRSLNSFQYRKGVYDIILEGYGSGIRSFTIDGVECDPVIPASMEGRHEVCIVLDSSYPCKGVNMVEHSYSLKTPLASIKDGRLCWEAVPDARTYSVLRNGKLVTVTDELFFDLVKEGEYQVIANSSSAYSSFASEPLDYYLNVIDMDIESAASLDRKPYSGYNGNGYVDLTTEKNRNLHFDVTLPDGGECFISFRYSNANGDYHQENKCANRTLWIDGDRIGMVVFPQCGNREYSLWQWSNPVKVNLSAGKHDVCLSYSDENTNMNIYVNDAALDIIRITRNDTFRNPVINRDWADPTVWECDGRYYSVATGLSTLMTSTDLVNWKDTGRSPITQKARSELFGRTDNIWAPCVTKIGDKWVLYISLYMTDDDCCIAVMDSSEPDGPFEWRGILLDGTPDFGVANAIDPFTLVDNGRVWHFFGSLEDGIHLVELTPDGLKVKEGATAVHVAGVRHPADKFVDEAYEGSYVMKHGDWWYFFASAGAFYDGTYRLVVARSKNLCGPYYDREGHPFTEGKAKPILSSSEGDYFIGPGHNGNVFTNSDGQMYMFFHSHSKDYPNGERPTLLQRLFWDEEGWPYFVNSVPAELELKP